MKLTHSRILHYPFGKVPCIEINGVQYHQSRAIGRYLARQAGLYGMDGPEMDMKIDMIVDTIDDMRQAVTGWYYEKDSLVRKKKYNPMLIDTIPFYLSKLNKMAKENEGFLVKRKEMTWADIYFTAVFDYIQELLKTDLSARIPHLMEVPKHVLMIPKMRRWWDSRPRSHLKY
ncbi:hypothetical protein M8J77_013774 [Diaphorina citri]|nr:hypothetical protein M8J77_013774 [Diaphorina citri]